MNHAQGTQLWSYFKHHNRYQKINQTNKQSNQSNKHKQKYRTKYEVYAYSLRKPFNLQGEQAREYLSSQVDHWEDLSGLSTPMRAEKIMNDDIDILIDLSGLIDEADIRLFR